MLQEHIMFSKYKLLVV